MQADLFHDFFSCPQQSAKAVVLGNGPSLRGFDIAGELRDFDAFGMNAAYRYWDQIGWYPRYYACLDIVVGLSHKVEIARLIARRREYGIEAFLLRNNLVQALGALGKAPCVVNYDLWFISKQFAFFPALTSITTGTHTLLWAAALGYKDIILLGIDGRYPVEVLPESEAKKGIVLEIKETPEHNPNYFFDGYQQQGDMYHVPNGGRKSGFLLHQHGWRNLPPILRLLDCMVVNANQDSAVDAFPKTTMGKAVQRLEEERQNRSSHSGETDLSATHAREEDVSFDETRLCSFFLPSQNGIMLDVGAHLGGTCLPFVQQDWIVHAFEPNPPCRQALLRWADEHGCRDRLHVDARAVSDVPGQREQWYTTGESHGASSMLPFTKGHVESGSVTTVTLRDYCREHGIDRVDFLKIDAEGYDLLCLRGFPFESLKPMCVLCEFEDRKTDLLGYTMHDMAGFLQDRGYHVFVSEWHPILRYGIRHQWRRLVPYPADCAPDAWGNLLAFAGKPDETLLRVAIAATQSNVV